MNGIIAWFVSNRVAANVMMIVILFAGFIFLPSIPKEIVPAAKANGISILAPYPGASPKEVEEAVCKRLETAIQGIEGISSIGSVAVENSCIVNVTLEVGYEARPIEEKIKSRVGAIKDLPQLVSKIIVEHQDIKSLVAKLVVSGKADETALKSMAEQIRDDLLDKSFITQVEIENTRDYEISIEVSEVLLQRYDLTFMEVVSAVRLNSLKTSSGEVKTDDGTIAVTASGQASSADDYLDIVLRATPDGGRITLADIADVKDGFAYGNVQTRFDGEPAIVVVVYQIGNQNILHISQELYRYVQNPETPLPKGISLNVIQDFSSHFRSRIELLTSNAMLGLVLVFIALMLFLRLRLSFWVSMGIPIAFLGGIMVLPFVGTTINMVSTFAFLLVLGIVVDDAIIVGENVFAQTDKGIYGEKAAIIGAQQVAKPVIFAVITTMLFFIPLLTVPGTEGKLIRDVPVVVIATLIFSLIECLLILPAHLSNLQRSNKQAVRFIERGQRKFSGLMNRVIEHYYRPFLGHALKRRYTTVIIFFGIFYLAIAVVKGGWVDVTLISEIDADATAVQVEFVKGTPIEVTRSHIVRIEQATMALRDELREEYGVDQIESVGVSMGLGGDHKGFIIIELPSSAEGREISAREIANRLRTKVGPIPEATKLQYKASLNPRTPDIDIVFSGRDDKMLEKVTGDFRQQLAQYPGLYHIRDSLQGGKKEVFLKLKPAARDLGLTLNDVATQVGQAFHGVHVQSLQRGQDEVKVYIRYPAKERDSLWHLENMNIRLLDGSNVVLMAVADVSYERGPDVIRRLDGKRIQKVSAYADDELVTSGKVMADLRKKFFHNFNEKYPGVNWSISGSQRSQSQIINSLLRWYVLALLAMFALMAVLFRSYTQPIIVMSAIPFGVVGAMIGHLLLGMELTIWSLAGMIAVSGVVVNDNLVLIDFINKGRARGEPLLQAIKEAGAARFRPIWLTSLTTFIGLVPLMMETSVQAQFLVPMAVSLAFGELYATLVSLVMVPALYYILDDAQGFVRRIIYRLKHRKEQVAEEDLDLDDAYNHGYQAGRAGKPKGLLPYRSEVLAASWEAGWDDGTLDRLGDSIE